MEGMMGLGQHVVLSVKRFVASANLTSVAIISPSKVVLFLASLLVLVFSAHSQEPSAAGDALRTAAAKGDVDSIKKAIDAKADLNQLSPYGVSALATACDHGHIEIVRLLLEAGANPNTKDTFYRVSPLGWAISKDRMEIVELLIDHGAKDLEVAMSGAIQSKNTDLAKKILNAKGLDEAARVTSLREALQAKVDSIVELIDATLSEEAKKKGRESTATVQVDPKVFEGIAGTYQNEGGRKLYLKQVEERLELIDSEFPDRPFRMAANEQGAFAARGVSAEFVREEGRVKHMLWKAGDRETIYARVGESTSPPTADAAMAIPKGSEDLKDFDLGRDEWPSFRGPMARGINNHAKLPTQWDGAKGTNVIWKTPIPGLATSSPVVAGGRVYLTTAIQEDEKSGFRIGAYGDVESAQSQGEARFVLLCLDLATGKVLWQQEAAKAVPAVKRHPKSSHANPTPATDGQRVVAFFGGNGLYCYDAKGNVAWKRQLGTLDSGWFYDRTYQWGFGSSPLIFSGKVIVQCDIQDGSFIEAIDLQTGETAWKTQRDEIPTWSSPVGFVMADGTPVVYVAGTKSAAAYHATTGEELWKLGGFSEIVVPTPQVTPDSILLTSGYSPVQPIVSLSHAARGNLKMPEDRKATAPFHWAIMRGGPYMPTPIIYKGKLYICDDGGILSVHSVDDGKRILRKRVRNAEATSFTASPVAGDGHLFVTAENGTTFVVPLEGECNIVAENSLGESVLATPAIAGGKIIIRGEHHLYAIGTAP
ncbi:MAG: PQQ-binding-like beta-propeller repeat protein [Pirellulales bacterium]